MVKTNPIQAPFAKMSFPAKLYKLLEESSQLGTTHIISWLPDGKSFKVHKQNEFTSEVMSSYFSQTKYNSFRRQCYIYGFRLRRDGAFSHPKFRRDSLETSTNLQRMVQDNRRRKRVKRTSKAAQTPSPSSSQSSQSPYPISPPHSASSYSDTSSVPEEIAFQTADFLTQTKGNVIDNFNFTLMPSSLKPTEFSEPEKVSSNLTDLWGTIYDPLLFLNGELNEATDSLLLDDIMFSQELTNFH